MRKLVLASLALAGLVSLSPPVLASHHGGCAVDCCAPVCAPVSCAYAEQAVTCYRPEWHERQVQETVNRLAQHEVTENVTVTECVPVWTEEKRTCTVYHEVPRDVVSNVVECVPVWAEQKQMVTEYHQVPHQVTHQVTCTRMVPTCCVDPCTGCSFTVCRPECYTQNVTATVWECVPSQHEVTVKVCHMTQQTHQVHSTVYECVPSQQEATVRVCHLEQRTHQVKSTVYECVPSQQEATVKVCHMTQQTRQVHSTVYECVPSQQEYSVRVCHYQQQQKTVPVTRLVCEWKPEVVTRTVSYCTMVPYTTTVRVPVYTCGGCGGCGGCY
jgi:hypothetical protein